MKSFLMNTYNRKKVSFTKGEGAYLWDDKNNKYLVFSGIGNHQTFISMIKKFGLQVYRDIEYPDHYDYKNSDIEEILNEAEKSNSKIITTEKDYYRLKKKIDGIKYLKSKLKIVDEEKLINLILKKDEIY